MIDQVKSTSFPKSSCLDLTESEDNKNKEVVYKINEEALNRLPLRLQLNLRRVYSESIERLRKTNPNFEMREQSYVNARKSKSQRASTSMEDQQAPGETPYYSSNNPHSTRHEETLFLGKRGPLRVMNPDPVSDSDEDGKTRQKGSFGSTKMNTPKSTKPSTNYAESENVEHPSDPIILRTLDILTTAHGTDGQNDGHGGRTTPTSKEAVPRSGTDSHNKDEQQKNWGPKPSEGKTRRLTLD